MLYALHLASWANVKGKEGLLGATYVALSVKLYQAIAGYILRIHQSFPLFAFGLGAKIMLLLLVVLHLKASTISSAISFIIGVLSLVPAALWLGFGAKGCVHPALNCKQLKILLKL